MALNRTGGLDYEFYLVLVRFTPELLVKGLEFAVPTWHNAALTSLGLVRRVCYCHRFNAHSR